MPSNTEFTKFFPRRLFDVEKLMNTETLGKLPEVAVTLADCLSQFAIMMEESQTLNKVKEQILDGEAQWVADSSLIPLLH